MTAPLRLLDVRHETHGTLPGELIHTTVSIIGCKDKAWAVTTYTDGAAVVRPAWMRHADIRARPMRRCKLRSRILAAAGVKQ